MYWYVVLSILSSIHNCGWIKHQGDRIIYKNASRINRANTREDNLLRTSGSTLAEMPGNTGRSSWII